MGNNIKLNIEGITNAKNTVKQVLLYMNNANQELRNINEEEYKIIYENIRLSINKKVYAKAYSEAYNK